MQILSPPATSSEKHEPQWIEFIDRQVRLQVLSLPGATLTAAVPVPDLHAVLLLRDGVDPVIGLTAVPVVVVVGGAVRPLKVTLLAWGEQREAVIAEPCSRWGGVPFPDPIPGATQPADTGRYCCRSAKAKQHIWVLQLKTYLGKPYRSQHSHKGKPRS